MKTPEEIKKGLECCENDSGSCSERCPYFNSLSNGVDCASKMHADALALIQQLEAKVPKWISVEERLPDNDRDILVAIYGKRVQLGYYADDVEAFVVNGEVACGEEVTHWMPLPEPAEV